MTHPPSGTVTFLFTDIEGSTELGNKFPAHMPNAKRRHHELLRTAIEEFDGFVFNVVGAHRAVHAGWNHDRLEALKPGLSEHYRREAQARLGVHWDPRQWQHGWPLASLSKLAPDNAESFKGLITEFVEEVRQALVDRDRRQRKINGKNPTRTWDEPTLLADLAARRGIPGIKRIDSIHRQPSIDLEVFRHRESLDAFLATVAGVFDKASAVRAGTEQAHN